MLAFSTIQLKADGSGDGTLIGIASTPETDRQGDVLLPEGAVFKLPLPLLWQHRHDEPIGRVTSARVTSKGIEIVAKIALGVSEQIDRAYKLVQSGLVRGLSVGFRGLEVEQIATGLLFRRWEMLELSAVTIAANSGASITAVKAACGVRTAPRLGGPVSLVSPRGGGVKLTTSGGGVKLTQRGIRLVKPGVRLTRS